MCGLCRASLVVGLLVCALLAVSAQLDDDLDPETIHCKRPNDLYLVIGGLQNASRLTAATTYLSKLLDYLPVSSTALNVAVVAAPQGQSVTHFLKPTGDKSRIVNFMRTINFTKNSVSLLATLKKIDAETPTWSNDRRWVYFVMDYTGYDQLLTEADDLTRLVEKLEQKDVLVVGEALDFSDAGQTKMQGIFEASRPSIRYSNLTMSDALSADSAKLAADMFCAFPVTPAPSGAAILDLHYMLIVGLVMSCLHRHI